MKNDSDRYICIILKGWLQRDYKERKEARIKIFSETFV